MRTFKVTVAPSAQMFEMTEGERILTAARRAGIWLPFECGWGACGTCKVTLVEGEVKLLHSGCPAVSDRDARRRRVITCQSTPVSDIVIKPNWVESAPRHERPTVNHEARLAGVEILGSDLGRFIFELDGAARYHEGQYAILELGGGVRRCYSMSGVAGSPRVEFIAKRYAGGEGSGRLFALPVGSSIGVELPYGDMWLREGNKPVVLIAGGTGVSPILALARKLAREADARAVSTFYGAATPAELVCWAELQSLMATLPAGRALGTVMNATPDWAGQTGPVTDMLEAHRDSLADADLYLAGPPPMVDAVLALVRSLALRVHRIHYDRFG